MRAIVAILVLSSAVAVAGCAGTGEQGLGAAAAEGRAELVDASGVAKGTARLRQTGGGVEVRIAANGLPAGPKGFHVHTTGKCDAPDFASAGGHWNPTAMKHGTESPAGPHLGDMPNLVIAANGSGEARFTLAGATLTGGATPLMDADGSAVMIHAGADDYKTDPSGNSGGRIACGVVTMR